MTETAAVVEEVDGGWVAHLTCQDCGKPRDVALGKNATETRRRFAELFAPMFVCDACAGEDERAKRERAREEAFLERFGQSGMPKAALELRFDAMIASGRRSAAIDAAKTWAKAKPGEARGLLLFGPAGTGKTRLAATAAVARLRGHSLTWVSVAMLIARLQASFSDKDRAEALKLLTGTGPLVLDDLDKVNPSETVRSQLFVAIENRISAEVPLLVTTNLPPNKLGEKFGEAIVSRIAGYCLGRIFEMDGPDRRIALDADA